MSGTDLKKNTRIEVIKSVSRNISDTENKDRFVKAHHVPSGITVTKYAKSTIKGLKDVMDELEKLVDLWENGI